MSELKFLSNSLGKADPQRTGKKHHVLFPKRPSTKTIRSVGFLSRELLIWFGQVLIL